MYVSVGLCARLCVLNCVQYSTLCIARASTGCEVHVETHHSQLYSREAGRVVSDALRTMRRDLRHFETVQIVVFSNSLHLAVGVFFSYRLDVDFYY